MCLTSKDISILKEECNYNHTDIVLSNSDYRNFMAVCFKYKALYDTNIFNVNILC